MAVTQTAKPGFALPRAAARRIRRPQIFAAAARAVISAAVRLAAGTRTARTSVAPHLLTTAGLGTVDVGAFRAAQLAGWIVTGLSLLVLDWKVSG